MNVFLSVKFITLFYHKVGNTRKKEKYLLENLTPKLFLKCKIMIVDIETFVVNTYNTLFYFVYLIH